LLDVFNLNWQNIWKIAARICAGVGIDLYLESGSNEHAAPAPIAALAMNAADRCFVS